MRKRNLTILILAVLLMLVSANFALAQRDLGLEYPEVRGETITTTTTIPGFIRYIFNFSIIISVIIVIGVLIWGGFLYLTATGKSEQLRAAKSWIFNALLGLIILLGAYIILATVNPQLTIIKMEPLPLTWGVILLNEEATIAVGDIGNTPDLGEIANQISLGNIRQITTISDFTSKFGEFSPATPTSPIPRFKNFTPVSFFVLPDKENIPNEHTKVITFAEKKFTGGKKEYNKEEDDYKCGKQLCVLDKFGDSPPMSLLTQEIGPGIYLYGDAVYEEFFTRNSIPDFRKYKLNNKSLNDNAKSIAIKNKPGVTNYLAILHEKVNYGGQCRVFFEAEMLPFTGTVSIQTIKNEVLGAGTTFDSSLEGKWVMFDTLDIAGQTYQVVHVSSPTELLLNTPVPPDVSFSGVKMYKFGEDKGNVIPNLKTTIPEQTDGYGAIGRDLPSSAHVFQLSDEWSGTVTLCPATNWEDSDDKNCQIYNGPVWTPEEIIKDKNNPNALGDAVRSISIDGNFVVVLFEHTPTYSLWTGKCQVFTESNTDLSAEPIGFCDPTPYWWNWHGEPCTSAIAIYPIK